MGWRIFHRAGLAFCCRSRFSSNVRRHTPPHCGAPPSCDTISANEKLMSQQATLESVMALAKCNGRVCPQPQQWNRLYELLPGKCRVGNGWEPSLPLILGAWHDSPALSKMLRLRKHIEWASAQGNLQPIADFLASLPEEQWHHLGE